jgi:hypothetical protein
MIQRAVSNSGVLMTRKRVVVSKEALKRAARRSTKASAKLENREVPDDHVRSEAVQRYIDECSSQGASDRLQPEREGEHRPATSPES